MSIINKIKKLGSIFSSIFNKNKIDYCPEEKSILSQEAITAFFEKYKGARRVILIIVLWINIHIFLITAKMYQSQSCVDVQWTIFAGYWATILGTFIGFYTMSRAKEFKSETPYSSAGEWINKEPELHEPLDCDRVEIDGDKIIEGEKN